MSQQPVVVGIDGSPSSLDALEYAASSAARHKAPLHLAYGYQQPLYGYALAGVPLPVGASDDPVPATIEAELRDLAAKTRIDHPELEAIRATLVYSAPARLLIDWSATALTTVVGCRGLGGFGELLLGSVSSQLATYGRGPIVVVRSPGKAHGEVVVGYDGSPGAALALGFAANEAELRKTPLVVAHAYTGEDEPAMRLLREAVRPWSAVYPGFDLELRPIPSENADYALVEASRQAALTVVGSRGRGGFKGLVLGSVSRTLVHHAYGPVAVIHPAPQGPAPSRKGIVS